MRLTAFSIGLGVIGAIATTGANAQEDLRWFNAIYEGEASLVYGVPETSFAPVAFRCTAGEADAGFTYEHEPIDASDGVEVTVTLQAGDIEVPIQTTGIRLEMDDLFILEGTTPLDDRLIDLLTSQGTLLVFVEDGAEEYPLEGAREAAKGFVKACS